MLVFTPFCFLFRGPFVSALDKTWCPDHFICTNPQCACPLVGVGFVEENSQLFCERDYEQFFAPKCGKCSGSIMRVSVWSSQLECNAMQGSTSFFLLKN